MLSTQSSAVELPEQAELLRSRAPLEFNSLSEARRVPWTIDHFADDLRAKNEALQSHGTAPITDPEFLAARLYTGPMAEKYNLALRGSSDVALAHFNEQVSGFWRLLVASGSF